MSYEVLTFDEYLADLRLQAQAKLYADLPGQESTFDEILTALRESEKYLQKTYEKMDQQLDFNDEIIEIVELDEGQVMDISVAGDQLFYANGVLTKNSAGLAATGDFILAVIETEELAQQGVQLFKQIKSRYGDKMMNNKFQLGVKKANQRWYELDGPNAPKIPNISEDQIKNYLVDASKSIPITQESIELDKMANELLETPEESKSPTNLQDSHKIQAPNRSELDNFASTLKF